MAASPTPLLRVEQVTRSFYGVRALNGVDLQVQPGRITGLIGPNGAGKTTLFNCISGMVPPSSGRIVFDGQDVTGWRPDRITRRGLVRTFQIARACPRLTVRDNLLLFGPEQPGEQVLAALLRSGPARRARAARCASARPRSPGGCGSAPCSTARPRRCRAGRRSCWRSAAR